MKKASDLKSEMQLLAQQNTQLRSKTTQMEKVSFFSSLSLT